MYKSFYTYWFKRPKTRNQDFWWVCISQRRAIRNISRMKMKGLQWATSKSVHFSFWETLTHIIVVVVVLFFNFTVFLRLNINQIINSSERRFFLSIKWRRKRHERFSCYFCFKETLQYKDIKFVFFCFFFPNLFV